jgi:hypothetical protein
MSNPGLYQETHWRFGVLFVFDDVAQNMSGREWFAEMFKADGSSAFKWKSSGAGAGEGTIDLGVAAQGIIVLDATLEQHADVPQGKPYTWTLYDMTNPLNPAYMANGRAFIGVPGATRTIFEALPGPPGPLDE